MCHTAVRLDDPSVTRFKCMLNLVQEIAQKVVTWSKYPPRGTRGFGPMFSGHALGTAEADYAPQADENLRVIVQIESRQGVENVEEIAKVDGLDVLFIGASAIEPYSTGEEG